MHYFLHLFDSLLDHDFGDYSLDDLGYLHDLLDHSRHHYDLLNDFLDLYHFGNLHHFLDDFLDRHLDLFDSIDVSENFDYLLFDVFDGFGDFDVVVDDFLDLYGLGFPHDDGFPDVDDNRNFSFDGLDEWFIDVLCDFEYFLVDYRYFNYPLYLLGHFPDHLHYHLCDLLDLLYAIDVDDFFNYHFNSVGLFNDISYLDDLLYDLRNFHDPLLSLNNDNRLLHDAIHDHMTHFYMIFDFFGSQYFYFLDDLLHYFFDFHYFGNSNDLFDYLFHNHWHLYYSVHYLLHCHNLLLNDLHLTILSLNVVDNLAHGDCLFHFHVSIDVFLHDLYFRYFTNNFDDPFDDSWNFHCSFDHLQHFHYFFLNSGDDDGHFNRYRNVLLNLSDFLDLDYFLDDSFDSDDLGYFHYSIHYFLDDFFDFHYFGNNSEDFKNIVYVDHIHNLLVDHTDDSFVYFKNDSCFSSDFLEFFEKSFEEDA